MDYNINYIKIIKDKYEFKFKKIPSEQNTLMGRESE